MITEKQIFFRTYNEPEERIDSIYRLIESANIDNESLIEILSSMSIEGRNKLLRKIAGYSNKTSIVTFLLNAINNRALLLLMMDNNKVFTIHLLNLLWKEMDDASLNYIINHNTDYGYNFIVFLHEEEIEHLVSRLYSDTAEKLCNNSPILLNYISNALNMEALIKLADKYYKEDRLWVVMDALPEERKIELSMYI